MSLKAFHVLFISVASLLFFGLAGWLLRSYRGPEGATNDLVWGLGALAAGLCLVVYEAFFLRKLKNVSYL